jgi:hypothetical protein
VENVKEKHGKKRGRMKEKWKVKVNWQNVCEIGESKGKHGGYRVRGEN